MTKLFHIIILGCTSSLLIACASVRSVTQTAPNGEISTHTPVTVTEGVMPTAVIATEVQPTRASPVVSDSPIVEIDYAARNGFALRADGRVYGWGQAERLGMYEEDGVIERPTLLDGLHQIRTLGGSLVGGRWFITETGDLLHFDNGNIQLVSTIDNVVQVGYERQINVLRADGTVWMSIDRYSDLVESNSLATAEFQQIDIEDVIDIEGYGGTVLAIKSDGTLWQWGVSDNFSIPLKTTSLTPVQVDIPKPAVDVEFCTFPVVLFEDGTTGYWDWRPEGQSIYRDFEDVEDVYNIDEAGSLVVHMFTEDGKVLSVGSASLERDPQFVTYDLDLEAIIVGVALFPNILYLTDDGAVWSQGNINEWGELGNGTIDGALPTPAIIIESK